jgi:hypothetical protein
MKGIIYYTNNICQERIAAAARRQMIRSGLPITAVSQYPIPELRGLVLPLISGVEAMFEQQVAALERSEADVVFLCEHDVLYHQSHFALDATPGVYCCNTNVWTVSAETGEALWYDDKHGKGRRMTSGFFGERLVLLDHFRRKLALVRQNGWSQREIGYEPGKIDDTPTVDFQSEWPNIDIKHGANITAGRFDLSQYKCRNQIESSWRLEDAVPGWGVTKGRFGDFLRDTYDY